MGKYFFGAICTVASLFLLTMFVFSDTFIPSVSKEITLQNNFDQTALITAGQGLGSGVLYDPWTVLTACHVVVDNECQLGDKELKPETGIMITVMGRTFSGTVVKFDPYADLALVDLKTVLGVDSTGVNPVTISCDPLEIKRDVIYGIGHPHGMEKNIKAGLLSSKIASLPGFLKMTAGPPWVKQLFPTIGAAIEREHKYFNMFDIMLLPGNSGGGIFDDRGHLIGIVSHIIKQPEQITPQAGPRSSVVGIPTGYTYATKPERICEFLRSYNGKGYDQT